MYYTIIQLKSISETLKDTTRLSMVLNYKNCIYAH